MSDIVARTGQWCTGCGEYKSFSEFYRNRASQDGYRSRCKRCLRGKGGKRWSEKRKPKEVLPVGQKRCAQCKEVLSTELFYKDRGCIDGCHSYCKECAKKKRKDNTYEGYRNRKLRELYGLTLQEYNEMLEAQCGVCAACGRPEEILHYGKPCTLAVDHSRVTGAVRGLLCANCNRALGLLYEDPERIKGLLKYTLERVLY